jgi:starvation-inducible DNA-binding protein
MPDNAKLKLANNVAMNLGNAVVFTFKAQGHHWNVEGEDFSQFHNFFGEIYEDVQDSIDPLAENLRKLDMKAPSNLIEFAQCSCITDSPSCDNVFMMLEDLYTANNQFILSLNEGFKLSEAASEYGINDFYGGRIDMHKKWEWMLRSHLRGQRGLGY